MGVLRFLLALVVLLGHAGPVTTFNLLGNNGGLAVNAFFIISGFYMSLIVSKYQLHRLNVENVKNFYLSRFVRIYSIYFICVILTLIFSRYHIVNIQHRFMHTLNSFPYLSDKLAYIAENVFLFGQDWMRLFVYNGQHFIFDPANKTGVAPDFQGSSYAILGQSWSLASELTFYLLVPFLLTRSKKFIVTLCLLSFALRISLVPFYSIYVNVFFPAILGLFLLGALSHQFIYTKLKQHVSSKMKILSFALIFSLAAMFLFLFSDLINIYNYQFWFKSWIFLFCITFTIPFLFLYCKNSRLDRYIGELSYPVYMTHFLCLGLAARLGYAKDTYVAILLSVAISIVLIHAVVQPLDYLRHKRFLKKQNKNNETVSDELILQN